MSNPQSAETEPVGIVVQEITPIEWEQIWDKMGSEGNWGMANDIVQRAYPFATLLQGRGVSGGGAMYTFFVPPPPDWPEDKKASVYAQLEEYYINLRLR